MIQEVVIIIWGILLAGIVCYGVIKDDDKQLDSKDKGGNDNDGRLS